MPRLEQLGLEVNPSADPLRYPGQLVTESCVVAEDWIYRLTSRPGSRIGDWQADVDGGPLSSGSEALSVRLDDALQRAGVAPMDERYPVLAVGSNAAPGQLRHKFESSPATSSLVPMTLATVGGIGIGHSAHVSKAGYVPYVPLARPKTNARDLFVLWLDDEQVKRIDETEPNYHPTVVSGDGFPAMLESGERLRIYSLYRGRWGVLRLSTSAAPLAAGSQTEVFGSLRTLPWFVNLVPEVAVDVDLAIRALGADEARRTAIRERLGVECLSGDDGLPPSGGHSVPYSQAGAEYGR